MAAAEARAVWQRTANRCFVQEDAKRAPKLACCQSSSSSSKQFDSGPNNPSDGPNHPVKGFKPLNNNSSFSTLPPDTRWWVQMQPDYGHQMVLSQEQLKALEIEIETSKPAFNGAKMQKSDSICTDDHNRGDPSLHFCTKMAAEVQKREVNPVHSQLPQDFTDVVDVKESFELMGMDAFDCKPVTTHSNEFGIDLDSPWIKVEKTAPWWRTSDIDDIVYLVSRKTHECIQNCDLPPPQKPCLRKYEHMPRPLVSKLDLKSQAANVRGQECVDSSVTQRKQEMLVGNSGNVSHRSFSCSNEKDNVGARKFPEGDTSKAELLEALQHCQTRAREAEKAAKQARAEKEHVVELFFKQASQLFAYKQWLRLLQFDQRIHIQAKDEDQPFLAEGRKRRKNSERRSGRRRNKQGEARDEIGKYAVAFAVGLSMVGAGLLLGWTVGWMLPPF